MGNACTVVVRAFPAAVMARTNFAIASPFGIESGDDIVLPGRNIGAKNPTAHSFGYPPSHRSTFVSLFRRFDALIGPIEETNECRHDDLPGPNTYSNLAPFVACVCDLLHSRIGGLLLLSRFCMAELARGDGYEFETTTPQISPDDAGKSYPPSGARIRCGPLAGAL